MKLKTQASNQSLVSHTPPNAEKEQGWFKLKPDIVISEKQTNKAVCVADTKWKRIYENQGTAKEKYGISQSDMYQMFAYAHKYLEGEGELYLIYPKHSQFNNSLEAFKFSEKLTVKAVAYDLGFDQCDISISNG